jgi:hypothetical protein
MPVENSGAIKRRLFEATPAEWTRVQEIFNRYSGAVLAGYNGHYVQKLESLCDDGVLEKRLEPTKGRYRHMYRRVTEVFYFITPNPRFIYIPWETLPAASQSVAVEFYEGLYPWLGMEHFKYPVRKPSRHTDNQYVLIRSERVLSITVEQAEERRRMWIKGNSGAS